jgi:hypothetical protein
MLGGAHLVTAPERFPAQAAEALREHIESFAATNGLPQGPVGAVLVALDRVTEDRVTKRSGKVKPWRWSKMGVIEFNKVADWIDENSPRPRLAGRLWRKLMMYVDWDTGEITKGRGELAELLNTRPSEISEAMRDLERIGAVTSKLVPVRGLKGPGVARWYMSPRITTTLPKKAHERVLAETPELQLSKREKPKRRDAAVVEGLKKHSRDPQTTVRLWRKLLRFAGSITTEDHDSSSTYTYSSIVIIGDMTELAARLDAHTAETEELMRNLEQIDAVSPKPTPDGVMLWYLNPNMVKPARTRAESPRLRIVEAKPVD